MSTFLFAVLLVIGFVWGVPFILSRLLGERATRRVQVGLFLVLCILFLAAVWLFNFADFDTQMAVFDVVFGVWGWAAGLFKLIVGYLMIGFARPKIAGGEGRVWHHLVEWLGYALVALGLLGLLGELFWTLIGLVG